LKDPSSFLIFAITISLLLPNAVGQGAQPAKVLVAGLQGPIGVASAWLEVDPLTDPRVIPARSQDSDFTTDELRRFVRLYFPRTYDLLLDFEYMILAQIEVWIFSTEQQSLLHRSIQEGGLGGMQTRSVMSMHTGISVPWSQSILSDAFPNDADAVVVVDYSLHESPMRVVINTHPDIPPIFTPYKDLPGVEYSFGGSYGTNLAIPKPGAVIVSYSVGSYDYGYSGTFPDPDYKNPGWIPHTMYWKYGEGITWTHQDMFGQYWNTQFNPYAPDMIMAELMYSTGRELPTDVVQVHRLRTKFTDYASSQGFIFSLLEFIEKFGANTAPVVNSIEKISGIQKEAKQLYLEQAYQDASTEMDDAIQQIELIREDALRLKDRALVWIYVVEWLSVTGVSMLCAFVLWSLMVQRKLYRSVSTTRMT
jgi:hypothetical protein